MTLAASCFQPALGILLALLALVQYFFAGKHTGQKQSTQGAAPLLPAGELRRSGFDETFDRQAQRVDDARAHSLAFKFPLAFKFLAPFAAVIGAAVVMINCNQPLADAASVNSSVVECGCPLYLGVATLTPTYEMIMSQLWFTTQAGAVGLIVNWATYGMKGALALMEAQGGFQMMIIGAVANVNPFLWKAILSFHVVHLFMIAYQRCHLGLNLNTWFQETFFTYITTGAVSFALQCTVGAWAAEALVASEVQTLCRRTLTARARKLMADIGKDGFLDVKGFLKSDIPHLWMKKLPSDELDAMWRTWFCEPVKADPAQGLDTDQLRQAMVLCKPLYNSREVDKLCAVDAEPWLRQPVPQMVVVGDPAELPSTLRACQILSSTADHNGMPSWCCHAPNGVVNRLYVNADRHWQWDGANRRMRNMCTVAAEGKAPEEAWPGYVRPACIADVRCTPLLPSVMLQANAEKGEVPRNQRRAAATMVAAMLSPTFASHMAPGTAEYGFIIFPILTFAFFTVAAAAGVGEEFDDVLVNCEHRKARRQGQFKGYNVDLPKPVLLLYGKWATVLHKLPPLLRLVVVNMALTMITLCVQFSFNYALLNYLGHSYWSVPYDEFWSRRIACVVCATERNGKDAWVMASWWL